MASKHTLRIERLRDILSTLKESGGKSSRKDMAAVILERHGIGNLTLSRDLNDLALMGQCTIEVEQIGNGNGIVVTLTKKGEGLLRRTSRRCSNEGKSNC
jgi:uncharacterized membrane protein